MKFVTPQISKRFLSCLLLSTLWCYSSAQTNDLITSQPAVVKGHTQLDSLLALLQNPSLLKEKQIDVMLQVTELYKMRHLNAAAEWAQRSIDYCVKNNLQRQLGRAYELYGDVTSMNGNFVEGASYFDKSVQVLDPLTDSLSIANKYHALIYSGGWLTPLASNDKKLEYGAKSLELFTKLHDWNGVARVNYSLGIIYNNKAAYERPADSIREKEMDKYYYIKALYHNKQAEIFFRQVNNPDGIAGALTSQAENNIKLGNKTIAIDQLNQAKVIYEKGQCDIGLATCLWNRAVLHQEQQEFGQALNQITRARKLFEKSGYQAMIFELYDIESALYEKMNNYKMALVSSNLARKFRDRNYSVQRNKMVASIQDSYENKLRNEQIRLLHIENDLRATKLDEARIVFWGIFVVLILIVAGLAGFLYQRQRKLEQLSKNQELNTFLQKNLEDKLQDTQLAALKAQMNPHFVFNAINSVQNLILQEKKEDAINYLNDFSKLTRHTLENSKKESIALNQEIDFLKHYLHLEQLRYPQKFDFEIVIDSSIDDPGYERIPPMMVQPFVENAIKHGFTHKAGRGFIKITFSLVSTALVCTVEDNGVGRAVAAKLRRKEHHSLATEITDARLELLQQKSDMQQRYKIQTEDRHDEKDGAASGTKVTIVIPVESTLSVS